MVHAYVTMSARTFTVNSADGFFVLFAKLIFGASDLNLFSVERVLVRLQRKALRLQRFHNHAGLVPDAFMNPGQLRIPRRTQIDEYYVCTPLVCMHLLWGDQHAAAEGEPQLRPPAAAASQ
jgi:hypothetical protein